MQNAQRKQVVVSVFEIDDKGTFDNIGEVNQLDGLIWPDKFNGFSQFEMWCPITPENSELLKEGRFLWCGGENAAVIEIIKKEFNEDGELKYNLKGRTLEYLLTTRIIWGSYNCQDKIASTAMYEIVNQNCINPSDSLRKIPFLENAQDDLLGFEMSYQKTGGEVYDAILDIALNSDLGFNVIFDPENKKFIFKVTQGIDRTVENPINDPVEFSTDLEDILASSYYSNSQDNKNVAFVAGEGEGVKRKIQIAGDELLEGFERKEIFVDARDLQSETVTETGESQSLTPQEYNLVLLQRGYEKLSQHEVVQTFEAKLRVFGDVQYVFGVDYKKGDKVTVVDNLLKVSVSARITEVEEDFGDTYNLILTFGYSYPTLIARMRRRFDL